MEAILKLWLFCIKSHGTNPVSLVENAHHPFFYSEFLTKSLKILKSLNPDATIEYIVSKELYRKVLYLNGLDCGHCAAKIESLAKKSLNYEKLLVDFASFRFIIESDVELEENTDVKVLVKPRKCFVFHKVTEKRLQ